MLYLVRRVGLSMECGIQAPTRKNLIPSLTYLTLPFLNVPHYFLPRYTSLSPSLRYPTLPFLKLPHCSLP